MCEDHSPEDDAVLLVAVIAKTGSLQSFIEAARKLLEDCSSEHIDEVADLLPPVDIIELFRQAAIYSDRICLIQDR